MKVAIFTFYMANIDPATVEAQRRVVAKFNKAGYPHYQIPTVLSHGQSIDLWMNWPCNIFILLDVDCVPLSERALDFCVGMAMQGALVGNVQRSNHIENGQHLFAAPSALALSRQTFEKLGKPSAMPTARGDVCEEWTYRAEERDVRRYMFLPTKFDERPAECESWALADGMPCYGLGTTFADEFYHRFQIRLPGQQEKFRAKCEALLC